MYSLTKVIADRPKALSKRYDLLPDGTLKKSTAAALSQGRLETLTLTRPEELIGVIASLTHAEAFMFGVPTDPAATKLVSRRMLADHNAPGTIARTKESITYPEGGALMFLDHDSIAGGVCLTVEAFLERLYRVCPAMKGVKIVAIPSASSHIVRKADGIDLTGSRGIHFYVFVKNGHDIPRAAKVLEDLCWCRGEGWIRLSSNGNMLFRTLFDTSVFQANRMAFASGADCGQGLEQQRGDAIIHNPDGEDAFDTAEALPPLDEAQGALAEAARAHARAAMKAEADAVRDAWLSEHRPTQMRALGAKTLPREAAQTLMMALDKRILEPDFIVMVRPTGETAYIPILVRDILKSRLRYHRAVTLDPLEPDYNSGAEVGMLFLDGRVPVLYSMAHGGATYRLRSARTEVIVAPGELVRVTDAVVEHMREDGRFHNHAGYVATARDGRLVMLDEHDVAYMLSETLRFMRADKDGELYSIDPPPRLLVQLVGKLVARQLPPLTAVLGHPMMSGDGVLLDRPGYYAQEKLVLDFDPDDWPLITTDLSEDGARAAIKTVLHPFRGFPFVSPADLGAVLAAVLTAVLRPSFPTAPAFVSTGPVTGAGKSALLSTVVAIESGEEAVAMPPISDEAELGKVLTSLVMQGRRYAFFDNLEGEIHSPTLQAFLTTARYSARPLTTNNLLDGASTRFFVGLTGTNLTFSPDMQRRLLTCRLDPNNDHGTQRVFDWDPQEAALATRKEIIAAALALVLAARKANLPSAPNALGSFPVWERIVRTTLRYAEQLTEGRIADPVPRTLAAIGTTGEAQALHQLHLALLDQFGWDRFTARDLLLAHPGDERTPVADALADVTGRSERLSTRSLGRYLQRYLDRPLWGLVLRAIPGQKALSYRLAPHAPGDKTPEAVAFAALAVSLDLPESLFGQLRRHNGRNWQIVAIDRKSQERPVIAREVGTGTKCALSRAEVLEPAPE